MANVAIPDYLVPPQPEGRRHQSHPNPPDVPRAQHPAESTEQNVDTGRAFEDWQHLTDDWFGVRPQLDDAGVVFAATLTMDYSKNLKGGADTEGDALRHLFDANLTLISDRLLGYEGGTFFLNFQNINGQDGSEEVGDFQAFSNIDSEGRTQLAEVWYEQWLFDDVLRIKVGKVDANAEFAYVDNGGDFINSSMGVSPTIFVIPTYPDPAMSVNVFVYPVEWLYLGFGLYDGSAQEGFRTGTRGPSTFFKSPSDLFLIGEGGLLFAFADNTLAGRFAVGGWGHTGSFDRFDGGVEDGTVGFYLLLDQMLWREEPDDENDAQGVSIFIQYGWADEDVSELAHHVGGGVSWTGALPTRDDDVIGLGVSWVEFSDARGAGFTDNSETAIELFYKAQVTPFMSIKPDLQYVVNPGGALDDALVGTVRVEISF